MKKGQHKQSLLTRLIDESATGIARSFIIPADEKLYLNNYTQVDISDYRINDSSYKINDSNKGLNTNRR